MWEAYSSPLAQSRTDHTGQHIRVCPVEKEVKKIEDVVGGRGTKGSSVVDACELPQTVTVLCDQCQ